MRPGIVGIRGVKSELYLCMNQEGTAHGTVRNDGNHGNLMEKHQMSHDHI